ncbi:MAG: hypothetical protein AB7E76_03215 [Deferribacterales bacterium]
MNQFAPEKFKAESTLNPYVAKVMQEDGIDISGRQTVSSIFSSRGSDIIYVITVCNREAAEKCHIFPSIKKEFTGVFLNHHQQKVLKKRNLLLPENDKRDKISYFKMDC